MDMGFANPSSSLWDLRVQDWHGGRVQGARKSQCQDADRAKHHDTLERAGGRHSGLGGWSTGGEKSGMSMMPQKILTQAGVYCAYPVGVCMCVNITQNIAVGRSTTLHYDGLRGLIDELKR